MSDQSEIERMTAEWRSNVTHSLERIELRIRDLENAQSKQDGGIKVLLVICAAISSVVGFVFSLLFKNNH